MHNMKFHTTSSAEAREDVHEDIWAVNLHSALQGVTVVNMKVRCHTGPGLKAEFDLWDMSIEKTLSKDESTLRRGHLLISNDDIDWSIFTL